MIFQDYHFETCHTAQIPSALKKPNEEVLRSSALNVGSSLDLSNLAIVWE